MGVKAYALFEGYWTFGDLVVVEQVTFNLLGYFHPDFVLKLNF